MLKYSEVNRMQVRSIVEYRVQRAPERFCPAKRYSISLYTLNSVQAPNQLTYPDFQIPACTRLQQPNFHNLSPCDLTCIGLSPYA